MGAAQRQQGFDLAILLTPGLGSAVQNKNWFVVQHTKWLFFIIIRQFKKRVRTDFIEICTTNK